jgi:hypothetical protein
MNAPGDVAVDDAGTGDFVSVPFISSSWIIPKVPVSFGVFSLSSQDAQQAAAEPAGRRKDRPHPYPSQSLNSTTAKDKLGVAIATIGPLSRQYKAVAFSHSVLLLKARGRVVWAAGMSPRIVTRAKPALVESAFAVAITCTVPSWAGEV